MSAATAVTDDLTAAIGHLTDPKTSYDREEELLDAGDFVAQFGTFAYLFQGPDLYNAQNWDGDPASAWAMMGHWSISRGEPGNDPDDPFPHADNCEICKYLEGVVVLRHRFEYELCGDCGGDLTDHEVAPDGLGGARAFCREMWARRSDPAVAVVPDVCPQQISDAFEALWSVQAASRVYALISRTFYLAQEDNAAIPERMDRQDVYRVCTDLADPEGTELAAAYQYLTIDDADSMDPRQMALNAPEPEAGEWQAFAPAEYKNLFAATV